jgi:hypothetical protein
VTNFVGELVERGGGREEEKMETVSVHVLDNNATRTDQRHGFNVENPSKSKGKNHGRRPATIFTIFEVFTRRRLTMRDTPPCGLQDIFIQVEP